MYQQSPARSVAARMHSTQYAGQVPTAIAGPPSPHGIAGPPSPRGYVLRSTAGAGHQFQRVGSQAQPPDGQSTKSPAERERKAEGSGEEARRPREDNKRVPRLCPNFVEFFNDNVNMMVMAATITSFANGLAGKALGPSAGPGTLAHTTMVLCLLVVSVLRGICLSLYRREDEDSTMRLVFGTILKGLPWFLRVPTVVVIPSYLQAIYNYFNWDPAITNTGEATVAFVASLLVFLFVFSVLLYLGSVVHSLPDAGEPDSAWSTFFCQCMYLAAMSGAGKAMYYTVRIPMFTLAGPFDAANPVPPWPEMRALFITLIVMTALAWFLLASTLPNQMDNPSLSEPFQQLHLQCQQYVVVYTWAFAAVDFGWTFLYSYIGGSVLTSYYIGMLLFLCWLALALVAACLLAATTPDNSFYEMGKGHVNKATACLMNYWLVDFITWWMQAQVVTSLDTDVADLGRLGRNGNPVYPASSSWPIIGVNFLVLLSALFLVGGVHACNHEVLEASAAKRKLGLLHHREKAVSYLGKQDSDDADDDSEKSDGSD